MTGRANRSRCSRLARSRSISARRGESGSSARSSSRRSRSSAASPARRRLHRSRPPITAESTRSRSHFQGARRLPSRTGLSAESAAPVPSRSASGRRRRSARPALRGDVVRPKDERFVVRRDPDLAPRGRRAVGAGRRDLAEREVFGEAARRELLERAVEQEQERAPGGVGAPRAPREEGRDARAMERGLEEARVGLRARGAGSPCGRTACRRAPPR